MDAPAPPPPMSADNGAVVMEQPPMQAQPEMEPAGSMRGGFFEECGCCGCEESCGCC